MNFTHVSLFLFISTYHNIHARNQKGRIIVSYLAHVFFNNCSLKVKGPLEVQEIHRSILEQQSYTEKDKKLIFTFR